MKDYEFCDLCNKKNQLDETFDPKIAKARMNQSNPQKMLKQEWTLMISKIKNQVES